MDHPNIIHIEALAWSETNCFLVFEYYPSDLWGVLIDKSSTISFTDEDAVSYISQLVSALDYLHQQGYSHSDIKPENIFVRSDRQIILGDLGNLEGLNRPRPKLNSGIYAAPEIHQGQAPGKASDLWELGIVIFFLLAPEKITTLLYSKAGYMNAWEFIGIYSKSEGADDEWDQTLPISPINISNNLPSENDEQWRALNNRAFMYALAVMTLKLNPRNRLSISSLKKLMARRGMYPSEK